MIRIQGMDELARKLKKISTENVTELLESAFVDGADVIGEGAVRRAPVATGDLQRSIKVKKGRKRKGVVRRIISFGGKKAPYAFHVETGTEHQPPRPFIRPAFYAAAPAIIRDIEARADKELSK